MVSDFSGVFNELRPLLLPYAGQLDVTADTGDEVSLYTRHVMKNGQPLWFGAVQIKKNYVSFHLMPVYVNPALLESVSPELKNRMQGKSCFNFRKSDPELFRELAELTESGFRDYQRQGFV